MGGWLTYLEVEHAFGEFLGFVLGGAKEEVVERRGLGDPGDKAYFHQVGAREDGLGGPFGQLFWGLGSGWVGGWEGGGLIELLCVRERKVSGWVGGWFTYLEAVVLELRGNDTPLLHVNLLAPALRLPFVESKRREVFLLATSLDQVTLQLRTGHQTISPELETTVPIGNHGGLESFLFLLRVEEGVGL